MDRRLGRLLDDEERRAYGEDDGRGERAGLGEERERQADREHRPGHVDHLVEDRFEGEGGVELRRAAVELGPTGADHGGHARHHAGDEGEEEEQPVRSAEPRIEDQSDEGRDRDRGGRDEHAALAPAVDEPRYLRRDQGVGEGKGRRNRASQTVAAMSLAEHGDDADGDHGERQPGEEAGRREGARAGGAEDRDIGIGHDACVNRTRRRKSQGPRRGTGSSSCRRKELRPGRRSFGRPGLPRYCGGA